MPTIPPRRRRWLRWVVPGAAGILAVALIGAGSVVALWPLTPSVADAGQRVSALLAPHDADELRALPRPNRVGMAVVAVENSRFAANFGVDFISLFRTVAGTVTGSQDTGAATLEMQLAKNLYAPRDDLVAKVKVVELAFKLDARYPKDEILRMYLAVVYYGHGFYGLPAAARGYFGVTPDRLSWAQASLLAGLVQAPSAYDPHLRLDLAKSRQRHVLDRLAATHVLTSSDADAAYATKLTFL